MINIYNEMTKKKEVFEPLVQGEVKMYVCGPTVYDYFHAGTARCFVIFDFIRRVVEYAGYKVNYVMNFTDIDDKMIARANRENISVSELADRFIGEYYKDAEALGVTPADACPRATEHIGEIIEIIEILIDKGHAYKSEKSADVYFSTKSFKDYGKLSGKKIEDLQQGERVGETILEEKRDPLDFALWKSKKDGEPYWDSPWGEGRPGWHIECSAMARKYLGDMIDVHCGGKDLEFPHHENELAQSECATGKQFARYWLHNGMLNIDNEKMSKSAGNFFTARVIAEKYGYMPVRFMILSANYRMPLNFSEDVIKAAHNSLERIFLFGENLNFAIESGNAGLQEDMCDLIKYRDKFKEALFDDFNSAAAVSVLFELIKDVNKKMSDGAADKKYLETARELYDEFCGLFGFVQEQKESDISDEYIAEQIEARIAAKKAKDFKAADGIRDSLKDLGIILEDTPSGTKWRRE
jgi:cysteinyl-tRNA synthetase